MDPLCCVRPRPARRCFLRRTCANLSRFARVFIDIAHKRNQVLLVWVCPAPYQVVGAFGVGGDQSAYTQWVADAAVEEFGLSAPVGGDHRQPARHRFENGQSPSLTLSWVGFLARDMGVCQPLRSEPAVSW